MSIAIVGCGFLGSLVAEEVAKRFFAFEEQQDFVLIDSDVVEARNAANQNFARIDAGSTKVDAIGDKLADYYFQSRELYRRLSAGNIDTLLRPDQVHLIIDAVDNIETRRLIWYHAKQHRIPIVHLGASQAGSGEVSWTIGDYDTWSLSPLNTLGRRAKIEAAENVPKELKPCELIAFRGLGLNTAIAAAKAIGIWHGFDPEKELPFDVLPKIATTWISDNHSHQLMETAWDTGQGFGRVVPPSAADDVYWTEMEKVGIMAEEVSDG